MRKSTRPGIALSSNTRPVQATYDVHLLFPVLFLVGIGIVMIYSASSALALKKFGNEYFFLKKQGLFALMGLLTLVMFRHIPYRLFWAGAYPILVTAMLLLVALHIPGFGFSAGGSTRWFHIGGVSFQPSEFAKLALVIYLAYSLAKKRDQIADFKIGFLPHVMVFGSLSLLVAIQPDFGAVMILGAITWIMLFVGGVRILHLLGPLAVLLPMGYFFMMNAQYRIRRIMSFANPWQYPSDEGYQVINSLLAFGSGGIWGVGIGKGHQKLFYLPEPHTDFIFSIVGEELGLMGVLFVLILYVMIVWRGIWVATHARDRFGMYLAAGLTVAIGLQVFINMGVCLGLLPTKGLVLPFLSYGGSSLLLSMASIGMLMNIEASVGQRI